MKKFIFHKILLVLVFFPSFFSFANSKESINYHLNDSLIYFAAIKPLPKIQLFEEINDGPIVKVLIENEKKINYIEDNLGMDCLKYSVIVGKPNYKVGEKAQITVKLEYLDWLHQNFRNEDCQNLAIKMVFPNGFVQTGGSYFDYMPIELNEKNKSLEINIEGIFLEINSLSCFTLLKGPKVSNSETIFIRKNETCVFVTENENPKSIAKSIKEITIQAPEQKAVTAVSPRPTASPISIWCRGVASLSASNCVGGIYTWYNDATGGSILGSGNSGTYVTPFELNESTVYSVTCTQDGKDESPRRTIAITITKPSASNRSTEIDPVCTGTNISLVARPNSITEYTYLWTGPDQLSNSNRVAVVEVPAENGVYSVTVTKDGVSCIATTQVYVKPTPVISQVNGLEKLCIGNSLNLTSDLPNGTWGTTTATRATVDNNGMVTGLTAGIARINYTVNSCLSSAFLVTILTPPSDITGSSNVCEGSSIRLTSTGAGLWESSNPLVATVDQTGRVFGNVAGTTLITKTNDICSKSFSVTVLPKPIISGDNFICVGDTKSLNINLSGGVWSSSNLDRITIDPNTGVITGISTGFSNITYSINGCISSNFLVSVNPIPNIRGTVSTVCLGSFIDLEITNVPGGIWSSSTENIATIDQNGRLNGLSLGTSVISYTSPSSCVVTRTITVINNPSPAPTINQLNTEVCEGTPFRLNGSWTGTDPATYSWTIPTQPTTTKINGKVYNALAENSVVALSGTYTFTVKVGSCITTATTNVTIGAQPTLAAASSNSPVCSGQSLNLNATGGNSYSWSGPNGAVSNVIENVVSSMAGIYTVTVKNAGCNITLTATTNVLINEMPIPIFNGNTTVCEGGVLDIQISGITDYFWTDPNGLFLPDLNMSNLRLEDAGLYTLNQTNSVCELNRTLEIIVLPKPVGPTVSASGPLTLCEGGSVTLTASGCSGTTTWSTGAIGNTLLVNTTDTYSATCTNDNSCVSNASLATIVTVSPKPSPPIIIASGPLTFCELDTVFLRATACSGTITWSTGATSDSIFVTYSGNFTATCTNSNGCVSNPSLEVSTIVNPISAPPTVTASGPLTICEGDTVIFTASDCLGTVTWSTGATGTELLVYDSGSYSATCTISNSCQSFPSFPLVVTVNPKPELLIITANRSLSICEGDTVILTSSSCVGNILWSTGQTTSSILVSNAGAYSATCTLGGCFSGISNILNISVNAIPQAPTISASTTIICSGGTSILTASGCTGTVIWSNGDTGNSILVSTSGTYSATCNIGTVCFSQVSNTVVINTANLSIIPIISIEGGNNSLCSGSTLTLKSSGCSNGILWSNGATSTSIIVSSSGNYSAKCSYSGVCLGNQSNTLTINSVSSPLIPIVEVNASTDNYGNNHYSASTRILTIQNRFISPQFFVNNCNGTVVWSDGRTGSSNIYSNSELNALVGQTITATCTNSNGCTSQASIPISITRCNFSTPTLSVNNPTPNPCETITFTATGCDMNFYYYQLYQFDQGGNMILNGNNYINGNISFKPKQNSNFVVYCVSKTSSNTCNSISSNSVSISMPYDVKAPIIQNNRSAICNNQNTPLTATGCDGGVVKWYWGSSVLASRFVKQGDNLDLIPNNSNLSRIDQGQYFNYTYVATCTLNGCESQESIAFVSVYKTPPSPPTVTPTGPINICSGTQVILAASCASGIRLEWSQNGIVSAGFNSNTNRVTPTQDAAYFATCVGESTNNTNNPGGCPSVPSNITFIRVGTQIPPTPILTASKTTFCQGSSDTLTINAANCNGTINWQWTNADASTGTATSTGSLTVNGLTQNRNYRAKCVNGCGESLNWSQPLSITYEITLIKPIITSNQKSICLGDSSIISLQNCNGNIIWDKPLTVINSTSWSAKPSITTNYVAYCQSGIGGCNSDTTQIQISLKERIKPILKYASDSLVCVNTNIVFEVSNCIDTVRWSNGQTTLVGANGKSTLFTPVSGNTTYFAKCKTVSCYEAQNSDTLSVFLRDRPISPTVNYSSTSICIGDSLIANASGCNGSTIWSNGFVGNVLKTKPSSSNIYYAYCSNSCGISFASPFTIIEVNAPSNVSITVSDTLICLGDSVSLTANGCNGTVTWTAPFGTYVGNNFKVFPTDTTTYTAYCNLNSCFSSIASQTIYIRPANQKPIITTNTGQNFVCGGSSLTLRASGCKTGTLVWSSGQVGVDSIIVTPTTNQQTYTVECQNICSNLVSDSTIIKEFFPITPVINTLDSIKLCYGEKFDLKVNSVCEYGLVGWNNNLLFFGDSLQLTADFTGVRVYAAKCLIGNCSSQYTNVSTVFVSEKPNPKILYDTTIHVGERLDVSLDPNGSNLDMVKWRGPSAFNDSLHTVGFNIRIDSAKLGHSGQYIMTAINQGACADSVKIDITVLDADCGCTDCETLSTINPVVMPEKSFGNNNYILETTYLKGYQNIPTLAEGNQTISYFDGMGRPIQKIAINSGGTPFNEPNKIDIVSFMEYDDFGRESKKYLPFAKTNNIGNLVSGNLWTQQKSYFANQPEKAADKDFAFSETLFEESPLNRVLKQSSPGQDTQLSTNHVTQIIYGTNNNGNVTQPNGDKSLVAALLLNKVKQFDLVAHESQIENQKISYKQYAPNELNAVVNINEDDQYSAQFTDKEGKVVASRQYNRVETANNVFEDEVLETNYVYDLFGRLRFVIQPEASKVISGLALNAEITPFTSNFKDFVFYYQYDKRGRMTRKRVPGMSNFVTMEYDERDLLIKITDANGKITSTEYDLLKRPIKNFLQNNANETPLLITESFYDKYADSLTNGTSPLFPNFYHSFGIFYNIFNNPIGLPVATKTLVLNENNQARLINGKPQYLASVIYYDNKMRPLQTVSENIFGKVEITSNKLDFSGRILETHTTTPYKEGVLDKSLETFSKNTYDQSGRIGAVCQKLDNDKWEPISRNSYSPLGELSMKKLGCDQQRVDFDYNIKGWLTQINKPNADLNAFKKQNDLFAMKLNYSGSFTGNITAQQWQTMDKLNNTGISSTIQSYNYNYDELNRILKAEFVGNNTNGISTTLYNPAQANKRAYDLNGNIKGLYRMVNNQQVDALSYEYGDGNRLNAINDDAADNDLRYFTDLNKTGADYTYDAMGNMITDANKHLTNISYNHQNLPVKIQRTGDSLSGKMNYYYTGTGQKLMVEIKDGQDTSINASKTRYYLGGMVLKGSAVEFINSPEGRVLPKASIWKNPDGTIIQPNSSKNNWTYEYNLNDHLGNLRVSCRCGDPYRNTQGIIDTLIAREPTKAVQIEDYDAWGLSFGSSIAPPPGAGGLNRYLYNGKEQVQDLNLGLYEYGFRWYDAQIAKFVQVDPLSDDYSYKSTYDYAENKPINSIDLDGLESVNVNFGVSAGTNGIKLNINVQASLSSKYVGLNTGVGLTHYSNFYTTKKSGLELRTSINGRFGTINNNLTLGTNIWNGFGSIKEFDQRTGALGGTFGKFKFRYENDGAPFEKFGTKLADLDDKYRTAAATIGWGDISLNMNLLTGKRNQTNMDYENDVMDGGHHGYALEGRGKFGEKYTHGFVMETGPRYRFGGLTVDYKGFSAGINSDRYVRHGFQNIVAHDWIKDQRQFEVLSGGWKSNVQYSTGSKNNFSTWGN